MPKMTITTIQFEETEQSSEPDSDVTRVLEFSDQKFKTTMINMIRVLMNKVNSIQEQKGNKSREKENIRNHLKKKVPEIKNTLTKMKDTFAWPIHKLNVGGKNLPKTSKTKEQ